MNAAVKRGLIVALVAVLIGSLYVWFNGIPGTTATSVAKTYISQTVPAPGSGQKKVILQNLGMT